VSYFYNSTTTHLEHAAGLLVDEARYALDATAARQAPDCGLGDALDVVPQDFAVTLGATLAEAFAALAASRHIADRYKSVASAMTSWKSL
jgi:hypothetical protein